MVSLPIALVHACSPDLLPQLLARPLSSTACELPGTVLELLKVRCFVLSTVVSVNAVVRGWAYCAPYFLPL